MGDEKKYDLKKVKEVIDMMVENDLVELEIEEGDNKIHLKRPGSAAPQIPVMTPAMPAASAPAASFIPAPAAEDKGIGIKSPIVGTFYAAPSPDSPPYVKAGDHVTADTIVCIVEAMKVMNEIKAETSGTIEKVMVVNGQAVEFGQVLFKVRPD